MDDTKDESKLHVALRTPGAGFSKSTDRKASSEMSALKPYWGKPAVRNFRGGYGNGGIMRSPLSAIALLDFNRNPGIRTLFLGTDSETRFGDFALAETNVASERQDARERFTPQ